MYGTSLPILGRFLFAEVALRPGPVVFDEPIELPDGRKFETLADAMAGERDSEVRAQDG